MFLIVIHWHNHTASGEYRTNDHPARTSQDTQVQFGFSPFSEYDDVPRQHVRFARKLEKVAEMLISLLSPSLDSILLLTPCIPYAFWSFELLGWKEVTGSRINLKKNMTPSESD